MPDINPDVLAKILNRFNPPMDNMLKRRDHSKAPLDRKIGRNIRTLREKYNLTQTQLGQILNLSRSAVGNIERGSESLKVRHLIILCAFFEEKPDSFL